MSYDTLYIDFTTNGQKRLRAYTLQSKLLDGFKQNLLLEVKKLKRIWKHRPTKILEKYSKMLLVNHAVSFAC